MKTLGRFLVLFALFALPAFAEDNDLTLFAGAQFPGNITLSSATSQITDPANVGVFGVRYGHASVWGHEETFAYTPNFLDSQSKSIVLSSNVIVQAPVPVMKPYITAGVGPVISWGSGVSDLGTKFGLNYGGGLKVTPSGPLGIRFDVRGYSVFGVRSQTLKIGEVSVGVLFAF